MTSAERASLSSVKHFTILRLNIFDIIVEAALVYCIVIVHVLDAASLSVIVPKC